MAGEAVLRFVGDAKGLFRTFNEVEARTARSMAQVTGSVAAANGRIAASMRGLSAAAATGGHGFARGLSGIGAAAATAGTMLQRHVGPYQLNSTVGRIGGVALAANSAFQTAARGISAGSAAMGSALAAAARPAQAMANVVGGAASAAGRGFSAVTGAAVTAGAAMRSSGRRLTLGATLPLGFLAKTAIGTAASYEQSMNILQAASQAGPEEMAAFSALAKQLGADVKLPGTSAADAALAMVELSKAGLEVGETMRGTRGVLQLAATEGLDNAYAAGVTANALAMFSLKGDQATRVADLLAGAALKTTGTVTDMANALQMSGAVFGAAGVPIEDLIASTAMMAKAGIQGSDAGTSLKTMLMRLQDPQSEGAATAMAELGVDVFDTAGKMRPLRTIIGQVSTGLRKLNPEQRAVALSTIFGADAVRAANVVLGSGVDAFDEMKTAVTREGSAAEMAAARNKGFAGAVDALKSSLETLMIDVVEPILPHLTAFVNRVTDLVGRFKEIPAPIRTAGLVFAGLAAALGPLLLIFGSALLPIGLFVGALALVGTTIYAALNPEKAAALFARFQEKWAELGPGIIARLRTVGAAIGNWIVTNGPVILAQLAEWGRAFIGWIAPFIPPLLIELGHFLGVIGTWILSTGVPWLATAVRNFIPAFTNWLGDAIPVLWLKLGEFGRAVLAWLWSDALPMLLGAFAKLGVAVAGGLIEGLLGALKAGLTHALNFLISTLNRALTLIDMAAGPLIDIAEIPEIGMAPAPRAPDTGPRAGPMPGGGTVDDSRPRAGPVPGGGMLGPAAPAPATAGNAGRMIPMARGGLLLGLNRPTPILAGEGRGREDVLAVPHSKGGIGGMGGVNAEYHFHGRDHPIASDIEAANRHLGWKLALAGRR